MMKISHLSCNYDVHISNMYISAASCTAVSLCAGAKCENRTPLRAVLSLLLISLTPASSNSCRRFDGDVLDVFYCEN